MSILSEKDRNRVPIELRVLAGRDLTGPDGASLHTLLAQPKRFALLVYLLLNRPWRPHQRDELLAVFWPESPTENARNALSQALSFLRRSLGDHAVLSRGTDEVAIDRELVHSDASVFDRAVDREDLVQALSLYQSDLLEGFHLDETPQFERWLESERHYLRDRALASLRSLIAGATAEGEHSRALAWAQRGLDLSPHDEGMARESMLANERLGRRNEAIRVYEKFAQTLESDLQITASRQLAELETRIRMGTRDEHALSTSAAHASQVVLSPSHSPMPGGASRIRSTALWIAGAGVVVAAGAFSIRANDARVIPGMRAEFTLALDDSIRSRWELSGVTIALSRDGSALAYLGGALVPRLYVRTLHDLAPRALDGTERALNPKWSPDGKWLSFVRDSQLMRVSVNGGMPMLVADSVERYSLDEANDVIANRAFENRTPNAGLWMKSASGAMERLTRIDAMAGEKSHTWPAFLPGGQAALFEIGTGDPQTAELAVVRLSDRKIVRLGIVGLNPRFLESGYIVFARVEGELYIVPFSVSRLEVTGPPVQVLDGIVVKAGGAAEFDVASNGTLVYIPAARRRHLVFVDRRGSERPAIQESLEFSRPRFSPMADRLAVVIGPIGQANVAVYDRGKGTRRQLTTDGRSDGPSWSADGNRLAWANVNGGSARVLVQPWDASDSARVIVSDVSGGSFVPSGTHFIAMRRPTTRGSELIRLGQDAKPIWVIDGETRQVRVSPDGRWLAYTVGRTQGREVFVAPIPGPGGGRQVSFGGGAEPVWNPQGGELFYRANGKLIAAQVQTSPDFAVVRRAPLFDDVYFSTSANNTFADYDVSPDGKSFAFVKGDESVQPIVVTGWTQTVLQGPARQRAK